MSASSKKKLRKEQESAVLTEKQIAAQKEAKNLKLLTIVFTVIMAVILVVAVTVGVKQTLSANGIMEKNTTALTVGEHKINNVTMNYFFIDSVEAFYSSYGSYAAMFGLDVTAPLNEQIVDEESGLTWADDFMDSAKTTAKSVYALADAAEAAGFSLTEEETTIIEANINNLDTYAVLYGFADADAFLKARYGNGATKESYMEYNKISALAEAYYAHYADSLSYEESELRAVDAENYNNYSSYAFNSYYMATSKFDSAEAAEEAAKALVGEGTTTVEELDAAIAALPINEGTTAFSTNNEGTLFTSLNSLYAQWLADSSRKAGDVAYFASTSTDADGNTNVNGYYVILFNGVNENTMPLVNVRHILVNYEGGTTDETTGVTTYSDEEKAAAKTAAEELLKQWESGEKTEESFAALATENTDDSGSAANGGLYENVYPGQMVVNFNDWCFDESRKAGDTGIVESNYGYHVMYFAGNGDLTYRDFMIETELRNADMTEWHKGLTDAISVAEGKMDYVRMDLVLNAA